MIDMEPLGRRPSSLGGLERVRRSLRTPAERAERHNCGRFRLQVSR